MGDRSLKTYGLGWVTFTLSRGAAFPLSLGPAESLAVRCGAGTRPVADSAAGDARLARTRSSVAGWRSQITAHGKEAAMNQFCPYCQQPFRPSPYRPDQKVCSRPECQRRRRREHHRHKLVTDEAYRQTCRDSQRKWRAAHPGYSAEYRRRHPDQAARNRAAQRPRDLRRRLRRAGAQATAAVTLLPGPVWLVGPPGRHLAKNTVAFAQLLVVAGVARRDEDPNLEKNNLACAQPTVRKGDPASARAVGAP